MKRIIPVLFVFIMLLSAAGCGRKEESPAAQPPVAAQPSPAQAPAEEGDAAQQAQPTATPQLADFTLSCYADYPQVPDFGAINGYALDSTLYVQPGQTIYYYVAKSTDEINAEFWTGCERFKLAAAQLGYELDAPGSDGVMLYMTKCGDYYATVFFQQRRSEVVDANEGTNLFLVNVETEEVHGS